MIRFNVPFIPDDAYIHDLKDFGNRIFAVHFALHQPVVADARVRLQTLDRQTLVNSLKKISQPAKYLLANGRFQPIESYQGPGLAPLIENLEQLAAEGVLDGIIFSDGYFLNALSAAAPHLARQLEAVPSINFMMDSPAKLASVLKMIDRTCFKVPRKITLDRALNRQPKALKHLVAHIHHCHPGMQVELLANEGCLNHCSFRSTHEALIAAANTGTAMDTFRLNRDLGCMDTLTAAPETILASPFIRPEDVNRYSDTVDIIKLCGRTLGAGFLRRTLAAYAAGQYDGNLFDLLDASHWMGQHWDLPNQTLPDNFLERVTQCDRNCAACSVCKNLFDRLARPLPVAISQLDKIR